jgi:hypothetical protein
MAPRRAGHGARAQDRHDRRGRALRAARPRGRALAAREGRTRLDILVGAREQERRALAGVRVPAAHRALPTRRAFFGVLARAGCSSAVSEKNDSQQAEVGTRSKH